MKADELKRMGYRRVRGLLRALEPGLLMKAPERVLEAVRSGDASVHTMRRERIIDLLG